MDDEVIYMPGDIVSILDNIDLETKTVATIKAVEEDNDIPGLVWLYLANNTDLFNDKIHPMYGFYYWDMIEAGNPRIELLSRAVE
jgi:hypothetical protein